MSDSIHITIKAQNIGRNGMAADATGRLELDRVWYDVLKTRPAASNFEALGRVVFKALEAIERAAIVRTVYVDGQPTS